MTTRATFRFTEDRGKVIELLANRLYNGNTSAVLNAGLDALIAQQALLDQFIPELMVAIWQALHATRELPVTEAPDVTASDQIADLASRLAGFVGMPLAQALIAGLQHVADLEGGNPDPD